MQWDGLILGLHATSWEKGYKEHYNKVEIETLEMGSDWPRQQAGSDFIFSNKGCEGKLTCGQQCVVGITLLVGEELASHMVLPISVAYHPRVIDPTSQPPLFQAMFSYTLKIELQPGINHIGWCGHSPIYYQNLGMDVIGRDPTIQIAMHPSCFNNFTLKDEEGQYQKAGGSRPTLYAMGEGVDPRNVSIFCPKQNMPSLRQLAILGVGKTQFDWAIARQLCSRDIASRDNEDETVHKWGTKEYAVPRDLWTHRSQHQMHWIDLKFP